MSLILSVKAIFLELAQLVFVVGCKVERLVAGEIVKLSI
jgi:hypothetical protein